ncbi:MAG: homoserine dehydrogenase [Desulfobacterales bacterium]|nr:homoserine dehydrogenase [Desulfobacterales bacterium]
MGDINIGILGCGTVGTGVAKLLMENSDIINARVGSKLHLKYVADIDTKTDRGITFEKGVFIDDAAKLINDPDIDIVVETIGGEGIAKKLMLDAINNGKHVVTANKALLAKHGNEVLGAAAENGVDLAYEASVGGCMPIIKSIRESLVGNRIESMTGILNGTCNYILSKITDDGSEFETALKGAQKNGYAEADPTLDIEGFDTAHKLAILISLAYGMNINLDDIYVEGVTKITPMDIDLASQFGYKIKLLAISKNLEDAVEARVHPTMIPCNNLLSNVNGSLNAITVTGDAVGDMMLYGHGAGMMPTASAIISDIADIARNLKHNATGRIPLLSFQQKKIKSIPILPIDETRTNYYFRFFVKDQPGVLSRIAGVLGNNDISIQSVHQKGRKSGGSVPIVMLTHKAKEASVKIAMAEIEVLDIVSDKPMLIRIEDEI